MSDLISRHGAIDHLRSIIDATDTKDRYNEGFADGLEFCISHMATMPSVQPEQRWIPCSERLPEVGKGVLLTTTFPTVIIGWLKSDGKWMIYENDGNSFQDYIIAWMPLPEPYQGGDSE